MFERRIQVENGTRLTMVEMAGGVTLTASDEADILIRLRDGQEEELTIDQTEDGPAVSARAACEVLVPASVPVAVRQAAGNLAATDLIELNAEQVRGNLKLDGVGEVILAEVYGNLKADATPSLRLVGTVYGDANLRAVSSADLQNIRGNLQARALDRLRVSRIGGNLQARELGGALDADQVGGNALLKGIAGLLTLDQVAGNLVAKDLTGGAKVSRIGGNLVFNGELGTGCTYHFSADGNATLRLSEGVNAHLTLRAKGKLKTSAALAVEEQHGSTLIGTLGDGGAELVIEAKGNIMAGGGQPAFGVELGDEISRQVEDSLRAIDLEAIGRQVSEEMEAAMSRLRVKLETVDWERLGLQAQRTAERAMDRMQRDIDHMAQKAARHQAQWERKAQREARQRERREHQYSSEMPGQAAEGAIEPIDAELDLDEERLGILRMVEQGQISPQEAEMLLDALS